MNSLISADALVFDFASGSVLNHQRHRIGAVEWRRQRRGRFSSSAMGYFDAAGAVCWWVVSVGVWAWDPYQVFLPDHRLLGDLSSKTGLRIAGVQHAKFVDDSQHFMFSGSRWAWDVVSLQGVVLAHVTQVYKSRFGESPRRDEWSVRFRSPVDEPMRYLLASSAYVCQCWSLQD